MRVCKENGAVAWPFLNRPEVGGDPDGWGAPVSGEEGAGALPVCGVGRGLLSCTGLRAELQRGAQGGPWLLSAAGPRGESGRPREVKPFSFSLIDFYSLLQNLNQTQTSIK